MLEWTWRSEWIWMDRLSYLAPGSSANLRQDRTDRLTESPERQPPRSRFSSLPPLHVNPIALSKWAQNERGMLPRARGASTEFHVPKYIRTDGEDAKEIGNREGSRRIFRDLFAHVNEEENPENNIGAPLFRPFIKQNSSRWLRYAALLDGGMDGRYTLEGGTGRATAAAATLHTRTDETSNRASSSPSVRLAPRREGGWGASLAQSNEQLTAAAAAAAAAEPHSRAPLSAMSFILHQLISFQTYNSER